MGSVFRPSPAPAPAPKPPRPKPKPVIQDIDPTDPAYFNNQKKRSKIYYFNFNYWSK